MSLLKLWFIRNPVLVSYSICMRQGSSDLSGSQSALACLCVCARAQLGLREFNNKFWGESLREQVGTLGGDGRCVLGVTTLGGNGTLGMSCVRIDVCDLICRDMGKGEFKI
jgi:hypothetical protein